MESLSSDHPKRRLARYSYAVLVFVVAYVLSSGPVIALGCWLREATGNDWFYAAIYFYYPLWLLLGEHGLFGRYIEWWVVDVFHTVGPG